MYRVRFQLEFDNLLLISLFVATPGGHLDAAPPAWAAMEKYGVEAAFWELVASHFGYQDEAPTLKNLLIRLLVSDLDHACRAPSPRTRWSRPATCWRRFRRP